MNYGILFNRNDGRVIKVLESEFSLAMLKLFALNGNVSATRDFLIIGADGLCKGYYEGRKGDMPKICDDMIGKPCEHFGISLKDLEA